MFFKPHKLSGRLYRRHGAPPMQIAPPARRHAKQLAINPVQSRPRLARRIGPRAARDFRPRPSWKIWIWSRAGPLLSCSKSLRAARRTKQLDLIAHASALYLVVLLLLARCLLHHFRPAEMNPLESFISFRVGRPGCLSCWQRLSRLPDGGGVRYRHSNRRATAGRRRGTAATTTRQQNIKRRSRVSILLSLSERCIGSAAAALARACRRAPAVFALFPTY
jgi:hypothetical protein